MHDTAAAEATTASTSAAQMNTAPPQRQRYMCLHLCGQLMCIIQDLNCAVAVNLTACDKHNCKFESNRLMLAPQPVYMSYTQEGVLCHYCNAAPGLLQCCRSWSLSCCMHGCSCRLYTHLGVTWLTALVITMKIDTNNSNIDSNINKHECY